MSKKNFEQINKDELEKFQIANFSGVVDKVLDTSQEATLYVIQIQANKIANCTNGS